MICGSLRSRHNGLGCEAMDAGGRRFFSHSIAVGSTRKMGIFNVVLRFVFAIEAQRAQRQREMETTRFWYLVGFLDASLVQRGRRQKV